jgi:hypothetical protein
LHKDVVYHRLKKFHRTDVRKLEIIPAIGLDSVNFGTLDEIFPNASNQPVVYSSNISHVIELAKAEKRLVDVPLSVNNERPEWPKIIAGFVIVIAIGIYILWGYKARVEAKVAKGIKKSARIVKKSRKKASSRKKKI